MAYPGWWPNDPGTADSSEPVVPQVPDMMGARRNLRFPHVLAGMQPPSVVQQDAAPNAMVIDGPARWPGPYPYMGRQWEPKLGALAGALQHGDKQDNFNLHLPPPFIPWAAKMARSLRSVTQKFNSSQAGTAIPSVFVPTSASNFYGQLGSY